MKKGILLFFCFSCIYISAQEKRALLIGINQYAPPKGYQSPMPSFRSVFKNLAGPVNDVRAFQSLLISKYGFSKKSIDTLLNSAATRKAILAAIQNLLLKCQRGDVAFFMFAGHGSRVINTLSNEPDKRDESIVPADTYIPGVEDIRDKELAVLFNRFIDKGIKLTVFFDCCHSGSLTRGPIDGTTSRFIPDAGYDAKDNSNPPPPEARPEGQFLFIASAQNDEAAREKIFDNGITYGAFSYSFITAIKQQSITAPVISIFSSARAVLKSNALIQEPVIAASEDRLKQTLFGIQKGSQMSGVQIPVIQKSLTQIMVQGGFAVGLHPGTVLSKIQGLDTIAFYRIDKVLGVNKSIATLQRGSAAKVSAGDMLVVTNWVLDKQPLLKIYLAPQHLSYNEVLKVVSIGSSIKQSGKVKWLSNLSLADPYTTIFYEGDKMKININGTYINTPVINTNIDAAIPVDSTLYFEVPVPIPVVDFFKNEISKYSTIEITNNIAEAHYMLFGTIDSAGLPAYGLRKVQTSISEAVSSMPMQTSVVALNSIEKNEILTVTNFLVDKCLKLAKIKGWINLVPPTEGLAQFPYHLALVNRATEMVYERPLVKIGDKVDFYLVFDSLFDAANLARKFVYIFLINADGKMILAYPRGVDGNQINQFPKKDNKGKIVVREKVFGGTITAPAGMDNYFLLATEEAIPNHSEIFSQFGVRAAPTLTHPLATLLNLGNDEGTRNLSTTPTNWTLIKLQVRSEK
jgi:hypothetical protein